MSNSNATPVYNDLYQRIVSVQFSLRASELLKFLEEKGDFCYDEIVTQLEHALQCAALAEAENCSEELIVSALFHDIGHLIVGQNNHQEDLLHEEIGAQFLDNFFPETVTEPIRLHVPAKRYLCTTDKNYYDQLSDGSKASLIVQGGNFNEEEKVDFESNSSWRESLKLRRWDDAGKVPDLNIPPLQYYEKFIQHCMLSK